MADENININVKSNIGDVSKDAGNAASEFRVMGVSLNSVKAGFASAAVTAKGMFGSIKAGLISTGIGAFLVIIGSLFAYFTKTKKGAEMLERAFAGVGAVVNVITDYFSSFGETVVSAFENPKQAIADLWEAIKTNLLNRVQGMIDAFGFVGKAVESALDFDWDGMKENAAGFTESMVQVATGVDDLTGKMAAGFKELGKEINNDVEAAMHLKGLTQQLKDEEREFSKVRAQTRQDIQKARLDALDETKTVEERLAAVQKANDLELKTTEDVLKMQRRKIQIQKETMALSENMAEDLDDLAALEVGLIDLQTQSFQTQKRLATEMETLTNEIAANAKAAEKERIESEKLDKKAFDEWNLERIIDGAKRETDEAFKIRIEAAKKESALAKKTADDIIKADEAIAKSKQATAKSVGSAIGALGGLMEEGSAAAKAAALTQIAIDTGVGFVQGLNIAQKSAAAAGPGAAFAFPLFYATQVAAVLSAAGQAKKILGAGGGGGGGGSVSSPAEPARPAPQMMSGAFDLSGGMEPEPTRAYVVTDEMTNSQNQLANIRRRATI
tara:strand:- start:136 stop:1806 length:1671 start_codon:yes stop_codon:yes gene_type:complete